MNKEQQIVEQTLKVFEDNHEACEFILAYNEYIHKVDDIIDEDGSYRELLKMSSLASSCFSMPFWRKHCDKLLVVEQLINNQYADSVEWESSSEEWKQRDARCLSHAGYNMYFALVLMLKGYDALRAISSHWRERCHLKHLDDQPVDFTKHENCK